MTNQTRDCVICIPFSKNAEENNAEDGPRPPKNHLYIALRPLLYLMWIAGILPWIQLPEANERPRGGVVIALRVYSVFVLLLLWVLVAGNCWGVIDIGYKVS